MRVNEAFCQLVGAAAGLARAELVPPPRGGLRRCTMRDGRRQRPLATTVCLRLCSPQCRGSAVSLR